ncbi:Aste57867_4774 [Aphanomyces stellatus]|uniref:Aste57867_4774 protein n=1 Tax=Aphanomyces stellatus TaxID=120398 RepID=A0A485KBW3_9STRA|nr:hypothetical protein As57867_004761 [Aphanomyces stellatus]VFT81869.1 Aste57867_4774 [Aphanomyces stellatus]
MSPTVVHVEETAQLMQANPFATPPSPPAMVAKKPWARYHAIAGCLALASVVTIMTHSAATSSSLPVAVDADAAVSMGATCPPRLRKSWDRFTAAEKARYLKAIQVAMDRGLYQRFVEIHGDGMSNTEAHRGSCVFLLWHRKYLVGFENMLRSLAPEFACLVLPFYDYVQHSVNRLTSKCTTMEDCSPILKEMGGSQGSPTLVKVGGYGYTNCVGNAAPVNHSCESPGKSCLHCIPRGPWSSTYFTNTDYSLLKKNVLDAGDFFIMSRGVEMNPHNIIHNNMKGVMGNNFISPTEPIFYSHHSTIDLIQSIYHKCKVAPLKLQGSALWNDPRNFKGCVQPANNPNGHVITPQSTIVMRSLYKGQPVWVDEDPDLKPFFAGLPSTYSQLTDTTNLGPNSYSYEIPGLLGDLFSRCEKSDLSFAGLAQVWMEQLHLNKFTPTPIPSNHSIDHVVIPLHKTENIAYLSWRHEIATLAITQNRTLAQIDSDLAKIVVHLYDKYLPGDVKDFSPEFKTMWGIDEPAISKQILDGMNDGSHPIRVQGWEDVTMRYYGDAVCGTCKNCRYLKGGIDACYQGWSFDQCNVAGDAFVWCGDKPLPSKETCGSCKDCYYAPTDACYQGWTQKSCSSLGYDWCGSPNVKH